MLHTLTDDGDLSNGDEIEGDNIFSGLVNLHESTVGVVQFRAAADSPGGDTEYSPKSELSVVEPLTSAQITKIRTLQADAHQRFEDELAAGKSRLAAANAAVALLEADPDVLSVARPDGGLGAMIVYRYGVLGALNIAPPDQRGRYAAGVEIRDSSAPPPTVFTNDSMNMQPNKPFGLPHDGDLVVGNNQAFLASAFLDHFAPWDENPDLKPRLENSSCPRYEATLNTKTAVTFDLMRTVSNYGFVSIATHGDTFVESTLQQLTLDPKVAVRMQILGLGTDVANTRDMLWLRGGADDASLQRPEIMVGLLTGALVMDETDLGVTARFFRHYTGTFKDSFVNLGACRSLRNGDIAKTMIAKGAKAVVGYSDYVGSAFAYNRVMGLVECLLTGKDLADGQEWTVGNCYKPATETDADPAEFRLVPAGSKLKLKTGFRNGGFEKGKIAWVGAGDARILTSFGGYQPTEGSKMAIVSTGLGFTDSSGQYTQSFCVAEGTTTLSFDWNYISAEFMSYCNSQYQDTLIVSVIDETGAETKLLERTIDSLCASVGASQANIPQSGDPDGTYATGWQSAVGLDVSAWAGTNKDIVLKFSSTDVGDSIYDTAILIDNVVLHHP